VRLGKLGLEAVEAGVEAVAKKSGKEATEAVAEKIGKEGSEIATKSGKIETDFVVTESGVAIPKDSKTLKNNLDTAFQDVSTNPNSSRKFHGEDAQGSLRVRIEKAHPNDPNFKGTPDPLHSVDHIHIDRRTDKTSGAFKSKEKTDYEWPF
jgi:hypothetical protein